MSGIIVQAIEGEEGYTIDNKIDEGNSHIYASTSLFANYIAGERINYRHRVSYDKGLIGYHLQGLPFLILVNGFIGSDIKQIFHLIDHHISSLMNATAKKLSYTESTSDTLTNLIKKIFALKEKFAPSSEFSMSFAITYERQNRFYCAGFGIGDTGLVLRHTLTNQIKQLAYRTVDAFDKRTLKLDLDHLLERNKIFNVPVDPGDELLGYTRLIRMEEMPENQFGFFKLKTMDCPQESSLFTHIIMQNQASFNEHCQFLEETNGKEKFGGDCMFLSVLVPSIDLQKTLQQKIARLIQKMKYIKRYGGFFRLSVNLDQLTDMVDCAEELDFSSKLTVTKHR